MKRCFYLVILTVMAAACSLSPEQKAEVLIKENLRKSLYKPDTYKPVETKVDSAFTPYDDPAFFEELEKLVKMNSEYTNLEEQAKRAKSSMSLWSGPYMTAYGKNNYQEAKEEYDEANAKIEKLKTKARKQYDKIANILHGSREFLGYKAVHNYRADNNAGNTLIGNTIFFIDRNFETITYSMELEEYNQVQEAINQLKEQIEEVYE